MCKILHVKYGLTRDVYGARLSELFSKAALKANNSIQLYTEWNFTTNYHYHTTLR